MKSTADEWQKRRSLPHLLNYLRNRIPLRPATHRHTRATIPEIKEKINISIVRTRVDRTYLRQTREKDKEKRKRFRLTRARVSFYRHHQKSYPSTLNVLPYCKYPSMILSTGSGSPILSNVNAILACPWI